MESIFLPLFFSPFALSRGFPMVPLSSQNREESLDLNSSLQCEQDGEIEELSTFLLDMLNNRKNKR